MGIWSLSPDRTGDAIGVLCAVFPDFPGSEELAPAERRRVAAILHGRTVQAGFQWGRIDAWYDPIAGMAVWLARPALVDTTPPQPTSGKRLADLLGPGIVARLEAFDAVMQRLRAVARPDRHVYLDQLGVLRAHRHQGIATALLVAGHAWADGMGLPCALDTDTDENVAFYERRGYRVVARERLPDSGRDLVAMRRELRPRRTAAATTCPA